MNPLQRLIQQRLRERGWSYGEVARRGALPRSTVYTLATTWNLARPPRPATIDALAKGLGVPVAAVCAAAAESTGLHYYDQAPGGQRQAGDRDRELLIEGIDELSPGDRRLVAALVQSLRNRDSPKLAGRRAAGEPPPAGRADKPPPVRLGCEHRADAGRAEADVGRAEADSADRNVSRLRRSSHSDATRTTVLADTLPPIGGSVCFAQADADYPA